MNRIREIADMVKEGMIMADIGTDHALLPIMLVKSGKIPKAYACDVTAGPLRSAAENIKANDLSDRIEVILSDGFQNVPEDAECAVIAGMGYHTAVKILTDAESRLSSFRQILVQVNTDVPFFRRWLSEKGWTITEEKLIRDRGHDYTVISFLTEPHGTYSETEILGGPCLMKEASDTYLSFVNDTIARLEMIMEKSGGTNLQKKKELEMWRRVLSEIDK